MPADQTIIQLRLDTGVVAMLQGLPALEAWGLCINALGAPEPEDIATVMTHLGRRVVAYRVDDRPWRSLDCFNLPSTPKEPA